MKNLINRFYYKLFYNLVKENNIYGYGKRVYDKYRKEYIFPYYIIHDKECGYCKPNYTERRYDSYVSDAYTVYVYREGIDMDFQIGSYETFFMAVSKLKSAVKEKTI